MTIKSVTKAEHKSKPPEKYVYPTYSIIGTLLYPTHSLYPTLP